MPFYVAYSGQAKNINSKSLLVTFLSSSNIYSEAATRDVLWKKVFLEISQNAQVFSCEFC